MQGGHFLLACFSTSQPSEKAFQNKDGEEKKWWFLTWIPGCLFRQISLILALYNRTVKQKYQWFMGWFKPVISCSAAQGDN